MARQRFADREMKELIDDINSGVLTIDEQSAVDIAIFENIPVDATEHYTINEFGEIVGSGKGAVGRVTSRDASRLKRAFLNGKKSEEISEM